MVLVILVSLSGVQAQLPAFHQFFGKAYCNDGGLVPDGVIIKADVGDNSFTTAVKDGKYGFEPVFFVENANDGDPIALYVGSALVANSVFQNEQATRLDIYADCSNIQVAKGSKLVIHAPEVIKEGEYFTVFIRDEVDNPVFGAEVGYMNHSKLSQVNGEVTFKADPAYRLITAKKTGYTSASMEIDIKANVSGWGVKLDYESFNLLLLLSFFLVFIVIILKLISRVSKA